MRKTIIALSVLLGLVTGCAPEVGSPEWCKKNEDQTQRRMDHERSQGLRQPLPVQIAPTSPLHPPVGRISAA